MSQDQVSSVAVQPSSAAPSQMAAQSLPPSAPQVQAPLNPAPTASPVEPAQYPTPTEIPAQNNYQQQVAQPMPPQSYGPVPPTNVGLPAQSDHSGKAIASFVLSILGLPATLIPIVGVIFAILAIVFGSISLHSTRKVFAKIGIGIGIFVLLVSVFFWVKATQMLLEEKRTGTAGTSSLDSKELQTISTPCYTTKVPAYLKLTKAEGSCTFQAINSEIGEQLQVKVLQIPELTAANLSTAATADAQNVVGVIPGGSIAKQAAATFAGSQAYNVELVATDGSAGTISYVYDSTPQGNLVIILHTQAKASGNNYDLSSIESEWSWL